jgi:D-tyrosyl-tRNA(Tyr) deacylase
VRAVVARVSRAAVRVHGETVGAIDGPGLLVLLGVHREDTDAVVEPMARKLHELRILPAEDPRAGSSISAEDPRAGSNISAEDPRAGSSISAEDPRAGSNISAEHSCAQTGAPLLVVPQFTLYGDTRKGRRPSWSAAAPPERAEPLVDAVVAALRRRGAPVQTGVFGAQMAVESVNDGPFTLIVEV